MLEPLFTPEFPQSQSPFCPVMKAGNLYFISGQVPLDPKTGEVVGQDMPEQAQKALDNLDSILKNLGMSYGNIAKTTIYIKNMEDISAMNEVYSAYMQEHKPSRACVEVSRLAKDMLIEIEAVAIQDQ